MRNKVRTLGLALLAALAIGPAMGSATPAEESLDRTINRAIRAGGPFFTAPERALIERKCGYAAGAWDGFQLNMNNRVLTCTNGRRVDDPEIRAMLAAAEPRIERRVNEIMADPAIEAAIGRVAEEATAQAMREIRARRGD